MAAASPARRVTEQERAARWVRILSGESLLDKHGEPLWHQIRQDTVFTCTEAVRSVALRYRGAARRALEDAIEHLEELERDAARPGEAIAE